MTGYFVFPGYKFYRDLSLAQQKAAEIGGKIVEYYYPDREEINRERSETSGMSTDARIVHARCEI